MNHLPFQPCGWPQTIVEIDAMARCAGMQDSEIKSLWETHDMMARLFSARYRGSGRPFINHLAGTAGLALMHQYSHAEVLCAYAHAAYMQGQFGSKRSGASRHNRKALRQVLGEEAEALVYAYSRFDWLSFLMKFKDGASPTLTGEERSLLAIRILNEFDDSFDFSVYGERRREQSLSRLKLGADAFASFGQSSLAEMVRRRADRLRESEVAAGAPLRRKGSVTLLPPGHALGLGLRLKRKAYKLRRKLIGR